MQFRTVADIYISLIHSDCL